MNLSKFYLSFNPKIFYLYLILLTLGGFSFAAFLSSHENTYYRTLIIEEIEYRLEAAGPALERKDYHMVMKWLNNFDPSYFRHKRFQGEYLRELLQEYKYFDGEISSELERLSIKPHLSDEQILRLEELLRELCI